MPKFVIYKDVVGQYRWRLIAANNEIIAVGEAYVSKQGAMVSIQRVKVLAPIAIIVDNATI